MKNLIIENDPNEAKNDDALQFILARRFQENREHWTDFHLAFRPQHIQETVDCFYKLEDGDNVIFETAFDDVANYDMLFAIFFGLMKAGKRLNVYVLHSNLSSVVDKYHAMEKHEKMDKVFQQVLNYHNVIQLGLLPAKDRQIKLPSVEAAEEEDDRRKAIELFTRKIDEYNECKQPGALIYMSQPTANYAFCR